VEETGGNPGLWRGQKWTAHSVVQHLYAERCAARTDELAPGHARGTQLWLAKYNIVVKGVLAAMDEEEAAKMKERAEVWNQQGLDPASQEK
jgi:hypothetical protein